MSHIWSASVGHVFLCFHSKREAQPMLIFALKQSSTVHIISNLGCIYPYLFLIVHCYVRHLVTIQTHLSAFSPLSNNTKSHKTTSKIISIKVFLLSHCNQLPISNNDFWKIYPIAIYVTSIAFTLSYFCFITVYKFHIK